jgi:hypothetical protein
MDSIRCASPALLTLALWLGWPLSAQAQRLLDWPLRTGAEAEALSGGAGAIFWNPAATGWLDGRGEVRIVEVRGPSAIPMSGLALAGAVRLDGRTAVSAGYFHLGLGGMGRTTTSPDSRGEELVVADDVFRVGAAWTAAENVWAGVVLEHWRSNFDAVGHRLGAGVAYRASGPWQPGVGAAVYTGAGSPRWIAGTDVRRRLGTAAPAELSLGYGLSGEAGVLGTAHRGTFAAAWQDRVALIATAVVEPNGSTTHFKPLLEARLRLSDYTISVVREELASGFGAAHYFGLGVRF